MVEQHCASAAELLLAIASAPFQMSAAEHLERLCEQGEAHLDALCIVGDTAVGIAERGAEDEPERAAVVALLLAESGESGRAADAVAWLQAKPLEVRQAAWRGLRLASARNSEPPLRALLGKAEWDFASAAALDILAFHRRPVNADLSRAVDEENDEVSWLLAEAGGRMRGGWSMAELKRFLRHSLPCVREAALRASARCGLPELPAVCREAAARRRKRDDEAIEFLGVVGTPRDLFALQQAAGSEATAKAAFKGLGRLGYPQAVPFLLEALNNPVVAEYAAEAIERIIGPLLPRGEPVPPPGLSENELDLWEPKGPVDVAGAAKWWTSNAARFDPQKRWQFGLYVSEDPLGAVFDQLPLAIRYDVYLRQRALVPDTPDWELETWTWKQKNPGG